MFGAGGQITSGRQRRSGVVWLICLITVGSPLVPKPATGQAAAEELTTGWFIRPPYMMEVQRGEQLVLTGLAILLSKEMMKGTEFRPEFLPLSWAESLQGLRDGTVDFVMGAYEIDARKEFAYYSIPYREEEMALYHRVGDKELQNVRDLAQFFSLLRERPFRMGYTDGFAVGGQKVQAFFDNPPPTLERVPSSGYSDNLRLLLNGTIDFFIANPVVMDRMLLAEGMRGKIVKGKVTIAEIPVHILFSKSSIEPSEVSIFNDRLRVMLEDGTFRRLFINTILPFYLAATTSQPWFEWLTVLGVMAFALSGVILARKESYNVSGALVLVTLSAIGGGVLRDLFLGTSQIFILDTPLFFLAAVSVVIVSFVGLRIYDYLRNRGSGIQARGDPPLSGRLSRFFEGLYHFFDAWGVAALTIIGVSAAVEIGATPLWLWGPVMGGLTASGGVVLRDMVRAEFNIEMLKKDLYAEISVAGGAIYTLVLLLFPEQFSSGAYLPVTIGFIFALFFLRFAVLRRGWKNPLQFGDVMNRPERRLRTLRQREAALWRYLSAFYGEAPYEHTERELEELHNQFFYDLTELRKDLNGLAEECLDATRSPAYRRALIRLNLLSLLEAGLYEFSRDPGEAETVEGQEEKKLAGSFRALLGQMGQQVAEPSEDQREELRTHHAAIMAECQRRRDPPPQQSSNRWRWIYRMERMGYLLGEYLQATGEWERAPVSLRVDRRALPQQ